MTVPPPARPDPRHTHCPVRRVRGGGAGKAPPFFFDRALATIPTLAQRLLDALPQTQCTRCGYADCEGYALAMARGEAAINQCPPGGAQGIGQLAAITGLPLAPLDAAHGAEGPRQMMWIDEDWCIGCTLCLKACPVDAIVGSNKRMHAIIEAQCTGCELCLPACPVDCIHTEVATPGASGWQAWSAPQALAARERHARRQLRLGLPMPGQAAADCLASTTASLPASTLAPDSRPTPAGQQPGPAQVPADPGRPAGLAAAASGGDTVQNGSTGIIGTVEVIKADQISEAGAAPAPAWPYRPRQTTPLPTAAPSAIASDDHKRAAVAAALAKARAARAQRPA